MRKISRDLLKEEYYVEVLDNGLTVYLMPKPGYLKTSGIFATKFGSIDQEFIPSGEQNYYKTPAGVAHFLEHKLFETDQQLDATTIFAELGADVNAYTTYDRTAYTFSSTSNVEKCVELLLDVFQKANFTKESVEKEKGIIEQELLMYLDQPSTVLHNHLLENLYKNNYVKIDIGGTVDSIKKIDYHTLMKCFNTFYHPQNMVLAIVGNFDLENLLEFIKNNQNQKSFGTFEPIKRKYYLEDNTVAKRHSVSSHDVVIPKVGISLKFDCRDKTIEDCLRNVMAMNIVMDNMFDQTTSTYRELTDLGLIDNGYNYECFFEHTFAHIIMTCNSPKPDELIEYLVNKLKQIPETKISEEFLRQSKRSIHARNLRKFNSIDYLSNILVESFFDQIDLFKMLYYVDQITIKDLDYIKQFFHERNITTHIIYPNEK